MIPARSFALPVLAPLLAAFALSPLHSQADPVWEINVVGDMYQEGRVFAHPTPEKPAYYMPIVKGFVELGAQVAGDAPPSAREMVHNLAVALASQGYLASRQIQVPAPRGTPKGPDGTVPATVPAFQPAPSLIIVFNWGSLRAQTIDLNSDVTTSNPAAVINQNQMLGLIAGKNMDSIADFGMKTEQIMSSIGDDRYFVMLSAYDFNAYVTKHKRTVLWVAKVSVPSQGQNMTAVMPTLIKQGAPLFGRETMGPKQMDVPSVPVGHVEIGTATEVPPPPAASAAPDAAKK